MATVYYYFSTMHFYSILPTSTQKHVPYIFVAIHIFKEGEKQEEKGGNVAWKKEWQL